MGSVVYGVKTPTLELKATNCSIFNITDVNLLPNQTTVTELPFHLLDRPFEFEDIYRMSYNIFPIIGMCLTVVLSIVGSLLTGGFSQLEDDSIKDLVHPWSWRIFGGKSSKKLTADFQEVYKMKDFDEDNKVVA